MDTSNLVVNLTQIAPIGNISQVRESEVLKRIGVISENFSQLTVVFILITIAIILIGGVAITAFWLVCRVPEFDSVSHKNQDGTDEKSYVKAFEVDCDRDSAQTNEANTPTDEQSTKNIPTLSPSSSSASGNKRTSPMMLKKFTSLPGDCTFQQLVVSTESLMSQKSIDLLSLKNFLQNRTLDAGDIPSLAENKELHYEWSSMGSVETSNSFYYKKVPQVKAAEEENPSGKFCSFCSCDATGRGNFYKSSLPLSPFGSFVQNELREMEIPQSKTLESFNPSILDMKIEEMMSSETCFLRTEL